MGWVVSKPMTDVVKLLLDLLLPGQACKIFLCWLWQADVQLAHNPARRRQVELWRALLALFAVLQPADPRFTLMAPVKFHGRRSKEDRG